ncbi:MAG: NAD(P)H-dependent oxidoreductase subunit E [Kosmotoga sp.]|uniref:(2Fe-2S) ferredoxin domain-containing protein n=1 Tax=Kosmotoga sp. TaxID=1955248 RepID=UPI001DB00239|nr:NAD(P)H-dependent oxidoreductase subunit E [Kosmotoga sp.]MBO8167365.1 NAD(P)H-dependent oxidoreductase subunit E [Kosmotoga sp.]
MVVKICLGSSCHLKGSYKVVQKLRELQKEYPNLQLVGSLCFGNCISGISMEIDGKLYSGITAGNVVEIVKECMRKKGESNE